MLQSVPMPIRDRFKAIFDPQLARIAPQDRLLTLRKIKKQREQLLERDPQ
jgi:hypothetical protein